jgi:hypothetical protein
VEEQVDGDIQIEVPAPIGSKAGSLVIFTARGEDVWVRFSPAYVVCAVDDETELVDVMKQLVSERAVFAVILEDGQRTETTLLKPNQAPELKPGQSAQVVSWSGTYDRENA